MIRSDEPFRRPSTGATDGNPKPSSNVPESSDEATVVEPVILDPELHQSVWKPWQDRDAPDQLDAADDTAGDATVGETPLTAAGRYPWRRPVHVWAIGAVAIAALISAWVFAAWSDPTPSSLMPLVRDMPTHPTIGWSADSGEICGTTGDDHVILSQPNRLWSLDLRTGATGWSVDLDARYTRVSCLSGPNLVGVTEVTARETVLGIRLFDGATGAEVAEFSDGATVQVIPIGSNIALLGQDHTLSMVEPDALDSPIWRRRLPGPQGQIDAVHVERIDDNAVQLTYSVFGGPYEYAPSFSPVVSIRSGEAPAWALPGEGSEFSYERVTDVILRQEVTGDLWSVTAVDLEGGDLWHRDDAHSTLIGSRVFMASQSVWGGGWSQLREVDPLSGTPVDDKVFDEEFYTCLQTGDGRPMTVQDDAVLILDEDLRPQHTLANEGMRAPLQGKTQMFLAVNISENSDAEKLRITAMDAHDFRELWTMDLEWEQEVVQLGRHLVLVDNDGETLHGLKS